MKVQSLVRQFRAQRLARRTELRIALRRLESHLRAGRPLGAAILQQLARGWETQGLTASIPLLATMLDWLPRTSGPILECGSGLSTLVLAAAAAHAGRTVISLEHDADSADCVLDALPKRLLPHVRVRLTPLRSFGDFDWYSVEPGELPSSIGLVLCDRPPGKSRGQHYGLAPVLGRQLAPGCVVVLDDTRRAGEQPILERWRLEFGASLIREEGGYSVVAMAGSEIPAFPPGYRRFRIVALAPNEWDGFWMNRQQILSRLGIFHSILYATGGRSTWDRQRFSRGPGGWLGGFVKRDGVTVDQPPLLPMRVPRLGYLDRAAVRALARRWRRRLRSAGGDGLVAYLFHPEYDVFVDALEPDCLVYHAYDLLRFDAANEALAARQARLMEKADLVIASSNVIANELRLRCNRPVHVVPNGVNFAAFAQAAAAPEPPDIATLPHPRIAYIGRLNRKVDINLIISLARRHPRWSFVLVGPQVDLPPSDVRLYEAGRRVPNIHILGAKSRDELPRYMHSIDVGLLTYRVGILWTEGIYPLKLHEYLASGLPIVSSDIPAIRDFPELVRIATTEEEWSSAIESAISDAGEEQRRIRIDTARANTWAQRAQTIGELLELAAPGSKRVAPIEAPPE